MRREEALERSDPIGPLDWCRIVPFAPAAASDRLGWVGLEAARQAAWLVLRRPERRAPHDESVLVQLHAQHAEVAEAIDLAQDFAQWVRQRTPTRLDAWLTRAIKSPLGVFQRFATRLREDYEAVKAGVTLPWSNGPVEGQINRLKMLKRQMFGRAKLDLLQQRFLLAA